MHKKIALIQVFILHSINIKFYVLFFLNFLRINRIFHTYKLFIIIYVIRTKIFFDKIRMFFCV